MTDREALFQEILANPKDDAPRLVFADFLDETGDPTEGARAELIRQQIQMSYLKENDPDWEKLNKSISKLIKKYRARWLKGLPKSFRNGSVFNRGFLDFCWISEKDFLKDASVIYSREPLSTVRIREMDRSRFDKFFSCPYLQYIRDLSLWSCRLQDDGAKLLADCSHLRNLQALSVHGNYIEIAGIEFIARSPHLSNLRELDIMYNNGFAVAARAIAESPYMSNLRSLNIGANEIGADGIRALSQASFASQLTNLEIAGNSGHEPLLLEAGAEVISEGKFPKLECLDLASNQIGDQGIQSLSRGIFSYLKELHLNDNTISSRGMRAFSRSKGFPALEKLILSENTLLDDGISNLAQSKNFPNLTHLEVENNAIGPDGCRELASAPFLKKLKRLSLSFNSIQSEGIKVLTKFGEFDNLEFLDLYHCELGVPGARCLAKKTMPCLKELRLANNPIRDAGIVAIAESPLLKNVETLWLWDCGMTLMGAGALVTSPYLKKILYLSVGTVDEDCQAILKERFGSCVHF